MKDNLSTITKKLRSAVEKLKGPFDYRETAKRLDEAAKKTDEVLTSQRAKNDY